MHKGRVTLGADGAGEEGKGTQRMMEIFARVVYCRPDTNLPEPDRTKKLYLTDKTNEFRT